MSFDRALEIKRYEETISSSDNTLFDAIRIIDGKDHYTFGHSLGVAACAVEIGKILGFSEERLQILRTASLLHDIGKIEISDAVLGKPGKLEPDEYAEMRGHVTHGKRMMSMSEYPHLDDILSAIEEHHEWWNGEKPPSYLGGKRRGQISIYARIICVADSYDAMISDRPYKKACTQEEAIQELVKYSDTQFDPRIVKVFVKDVLGKGDLYKRYLREKRRPKKEENGCAKEKSFYRMLLPAIEYG